MTVAETFKAMRVRRGISQEVLAAGATVSANTVRRIEDGHVPKQTTALRLARSLDRYGAMSKDEVSFFTSEFKLRSDDFVTPQEPSDPRYSEDERINALVTDIVRLIGEDATSELLESMIKTHSKASAKARRLRE